MRVREPADAVCAAVDVVVGDGARRALVMAAIEGGSITFADLVLAAQVRGSTAAHAVLGTVAMGTAALDGRCDQSEIAR